MNQHENRKSSIPPYTWLLSRRPNFMASWIHALRKVAVEHLELQKGDRILDVGCGTGASFPYLVQAVGTSGEVVGVEISLDMARQARKRVESHGWSNVHVLEDAAQTVHLAGQFDGLLLFAAHEVLSSPDALDHLLASLQKNAHVVAFGAKRSSRQLGMLFNPLLSFITHHLLPSSTAPIDDQPWRLLKERLQEFHQQEHAYGFMYLVWGSFHLSEG